MKIQPTQTTQPTMTAKLLTNRIVHNGANSITKYKDIKLDNGKQLTVVDTFINGYKQSSLQYLTDRAGNWVKSKLKMFSGGKVFKTLLGERQQ